MIKQNELGKEFMKLTRYPLFLCLVTSVIFFFILRRLIPQFQSLYTSLDIELPLITKLFLKFLHFSPILLLYFTCLVVILAFTFIKKVKRFTPLEKMTFYLKIPVLKSILSILITHYFAIQLSYLLRGGLSIFDSLTLFEQQSYFKFFQQEAVWMKKNLREGDSFPSLLENNSLFTPELCRVVSHGLSNGQLEKDLSDYSSFLFIAFEEKFKFYFSIIQPVLFSLIGVIIFIMFISILLPMFHLLNSL